MKIKDLELKCDNCPYKIFSLCEIYTPYEAEVNPCSLCCISEIQDYDVKHDYSKIEKYMKYNYKKYNKLEG